MSVLQELATWSEDLPVWLSDAARRAIQKGKIDAEDLDDLTAIILSSEGIIDPENRKALPIDPDTIPADPLPGASIALKAIREPVNINALDHPEGIVFESEGLTVVYGENGAGKSGYARILKNACRARDQEDILPNVFTPPSAGTQASAKFEWVSAENDQEADWVNGNPSHDDLSAIAVFDNRCARLFVDDEQEINVAPYGVDVLREMARVCAEIKSRLDVKRKEAAFDQSVLSPLHGNTEVGNFIKVLGPGSDKKVAHKLATTSEVERAENELLAKRLADDPAKKATKLRRLVHRIGVLDANLTSVSRQLSDDAVAKLRAALVAYQTASEASKLAATELTENGELLNGTGSDPWRELVISAMAFAGQDAYPGQNFQAEEDGVQCVLCQQPLSSDAKGRLRRFSHFLEADTQKKSLEKRKEAGDLYNAILNAAPTASIADKTILDEIEEIDPALPKQIHGYIAALDSRRLNVVEMAKAKEIKNCATLPDNPSLHIKRLTEELMLQAGELEKEINDGERAVLQARLNEFNSRIKLAEMLPMVEQAIDSLAMQDKLDKCIRQTNTTSITRKTTEITEIALANGLNDALAEELKTLNLSGIKIGISLRGQKGTGLQKLKLDMPKPIGRKKISDILSEGEQQAIAISCFLAEVGLSPSLSGIVFDDPVSSLDTYRRELIAKRLARESCIRQVIVFTHELSFAWDLVEAAKIPDTKCMVSRVYAAGSSKGITVEGLPFEAGKLSARINSLVDIAKRAKKVLEEEKNVDKYELLVRDGYRKLRDSWERLIEEGLFGETVRRFRNSVQTKLLKRACVEDQDFQEVWEGMTNCSKYTHDAPVDAPPPVPQPNDFIEDVGRLKKSFDRIIERRSEVEKRRVNLVPQAK